jgi:hypothetical protein
MISARLRLWVGLGAFTFVQAGAGAIDGSLPVIPDAPAAWAAQGREGGEGGEGGEAGIDATRAAEDPVVYLAGLDVIAAHYHAGRDAYEAGAAEAAGQMFAHPIGEIYVELEPLLQTLGVAPFQDLMEKASELALARAPKEDVARTAEAVLSALEAAARKAPKGEASEVSVAARVVVDLLDRAARQYANAASEQTLEPYLDGYGFDRAARARAERALPAITAASGPVADAIRSALAALERAFPTALRPSVLSADAGALSAEVSKASLAVSSLK